MDLPGVNSPFTHTSVETDLQSSQRKHKRPKPQKQDSSESSHLILDDNPQCTGDIGQERWDDASDASIPHGNGDIFHNNEETKPEYGHFDTLTFLHKTQVLCSLHLYHASLQVW